MDKPKILVRLTSQLREKGDRNAFVNALGILRKHGVIEPDSLKLTEKGIERDKMSAEERAIERRMRNTSNDAEDYIYDQKTNQATLKYGRKVK
jgi:hypothetical protein